MTKSQRPFILLIILLATVATFAQEQRARTWIGGGVIFTRSTANDDRVITGAYADAAYDLRYGFQVRLFAEYRREPVIKRLFTGYNNALEAKAELRYQPALVYHFRSEGSVRPLVGSGVLVTQHYFRQLPDQPELDYSTIYNGSQNPFIIAGAGLCESNEVAFSYYFADIYSDSRLRGYGADFTHSRKLHGSLRLRAGVRGKHWVYRKGTANETSVFIGFHFQ